MFDNYFSLIALSIFLSFSVDEGERYDEVTKLVVIKSRRSGVINIRRKEKKGRKILCTLKLGIVFRKDGDLFFHEFNRRKKLFIFGFFSRVFLFLFRTSSQIGSVEVDSLSQTFF